MTKLSVNINKFATLRNARGGNNPDVIRVAIDCESYGAQGITVHPRPDERHITYKDVLELQAVVTTEFNIEGYPDERYLRLVEKVKPAQATLVPDAPDVITSNAGWDTVKYQKQLEDVVQHLKAFGVRSSIFVDPVTERIEKAAEIGCDRIELYTEQYATQFFDDPAAAVSSYVAAAHCAREIGLGINAGHDLALDNLEYFKTSIPFLDEVSIGQAIICDALYYGLENTIQLYLRKLKQA
jgi:pyridoxine 5-phosphate synthase